VATSKVIHDDMQYHVFPRIASRLNGSYIHKENKRNPVSEYLHTTNIVVFSLMVSIPLPGCWFLSVLDVHQHRQVTKCVPTPHPPSGSLLPVRACDMLRSLPPRLCVHRSLIHLWQLHYLPLSVS